MAILLGVAIILVFLVFAGLRVIDQYERGVVLTLGRYTGTRPPGLTWLLIGIQRMTKVDLRVANAEKAILEIQNFRRAVSLYAQAALRDVIGGVELDTLLSERDKIADEIKKIVDVATDPWGIDVSTIKIQDIELPADMKRVMAKQAEAERERRAIIIQAEGEFSAAEKLSQAANVLSNVPGGMSLRTLQTIEKINPDPSKTVIFALPIEVTDTLKSLAQMFQERKG